MRTESNSSQNCTPRITITMPWRISKLVVLPNFRLEVTFLDGLIGQVDLSHKITSKHAGVFAKLRDPLLFKQAFLEYGAVTWPGELDIAPDAMYEEIKKHGEWVLT